MGTQGRSRLNWQRETNLTGEHLKSTQKSRRRRVSTFKISSRRDGLKSTLSDAPIEYASTVTNQSNPKPGHSTGGARRGWARRGGGRRECGRAGEAGRDGGGAEQFGLRKNSRVRPPEYRRQPPWRTFRKQETKEIPRKPKQADDNWFYGGTTAALRSWLRTSGHAFLCLCKPVSCKA